MEVITKSERAAAAGNILVAHVEAFKAETAKDRYLTYAELADLCVSIAKDSNQGIEVPA